MAEKLWAAGREGSCLLLKIYLDVVALFKKKIVSTFPIELLRDLESL